MGQGERWCERGGGIDILKVVYDFEGLNLGRVRVWIQGRGK